MIAAKKEQVEIKDLKQQVLDFIRNGGWWSQDSSLDCFENRVTLRQIASDEGWKPFELSFLERCIEEGEKSRHNREQTAKFGKYFDPLWKEMVGLTTTWQSFRLMFTDKHCAVDGLYQGVLYGALGTTIRQALFHNALQSITKVLTDRLQICGKDNLTLEQLIEQTLDAADKNALVSELRQIKSLPVVQKILSWRNTTISHFDMDRAINNTVLPAIVYADIDTLIAKMQEFFNKMGSKVHATNYFFEHMDDIQRQIEHANDLVKNGERLHWLSEVSSFLTTKWDRKHGLSGSLLLHPAIIEAVQNKEMAQIMETFAKNSFVDLTKVGPQNAELDRQLHQSPFQ